MGIAGQRGLQIRESKRMMYIEDWADLALYGKKVKCPECSRVFDPMNDLDAEELTHGHDCEVDE